MVSKKSKGLVLSVVEGFTLLEILIVIGLIVMLAVVLMLLFNPKLQIEKAWDSKRKQDLAAIRYSFENYYNDKMSYPQSSDVCYTEAENNNGNCYCRICATKKANDNILSSNLCDPQSSSKDYLYQFDCSQTQPQWYRVCAVLSNNQDVEASKTAAVTNYNYGISSSNTTAENCQLIAFGPNGEAMTPMPTAVNTPIPTAANTPIPIVVNTPIPISVDPTPPPPCIDSGSKYCKSDGFCNMCGNFANCKANCSQKYPLYNNYLCTIKCEY